MGSFGSIPLSGFGPRLQGQQVSGDDWQRRMQQQMQQAQAQQSRAGIQAGFGIQPAQPAQPAQPQPAPGLTQGPAADAARAAGFTGSLGPSADPAGDAARAAGFTGSFGNQGGGSYFGASRPNGGWGGGFGGGGGWMRESQMDPRAAMQQNQQRIFANPNGPQQVQNPTVGRQMQPPGQQNQYLASKDAQGSYLGAAQPQQPQQPNPAMQAAIESMRRRQAQPRRTIPLA